MKINLEIFSPVQQVQYVPFAERGVQVFVKRDDLIHPLISGNKWRKLKHPLMQARQAGKNHLVTFGGAYSNHLLATAAAAALFGFKATAFVRGEPVDNDTLFICRLHGMQLLFVGRDEYKDKQALFDKHFGTDTDAYLINEGGASAEGARGCAELLNELTETYDHLFCACGTGTTAAGIINGIAQHDLPTYFHGVPVLKGSEFLRNDINQYLQMPLPYELHTGYHFGGYAKTTPELTGFVKAFTSATGIMIEPVYTGKMFFALTDLISKSTFAPGSRILAVHTGGLLGILGMRDKFR